jgi:hypothetical protein
MVQAELDFKTEPKKQVRAKRTKKAKQEKDAYAVAQDLAGDIAQKRVDQLERTNNRFHPARFYASQIGDCDRQMVYNLTRWQDKPLFDANTLALFDAGKKEEMNINRMLLELGFEILKQQNPIEIKNRAGEIICSGRIDGMIKKDGKVIPYEIKSMNDYIFNSIKSADDFDKKPYLRKYTRQLQMYLHGFEIEGGLFILSNFRQIKIIPIEWQAQACEEILQKLERCWEHYKAGTLPEPIEFDESICGTCPFKHLCTVEHKYEGLEIIHDTQLQDKLARLFQLKPLAKEYDQLDAELKAPFKANPIPQVFIGDQYLVTAKTSKRVSVDTKALPPEIKAQYKKETEAVTITFMDLKE